MMRMRVHWWSVLVTPVTGLLVVLAACNDKATNPPDDDTVPTVIGLVDMAAAQVPKDQNAGEVIEAPCPVGGVLRITGSTNLTGEGDVLIRSWAHKIALDNCVIGRPVVLANGELIISGESQSELDPGSGFARILLLQSKEVGSLVVSGFGGPCDVDLTTTFDASSDDAYHISGVACGRRVELERPIVEP